jgi:Flp pilus assembly protein TadG
MRTGRRYRGFCRRLQGRESFFAEDDGSLLLESAIALLVIVPMVFWLFEICMLTYTCSVLGEAARQGVRYAVVHGTDNSNCSGPSVGCGDASGANVVSVVDKFAAYSFHNLSAMTVQVSYPDGSSQPPARVNVAIQYTYMPYIQLPGLGQKIKMNAQGRVLY